MFASAALDYTLYRSSLLLVAELGASQDYAGRRPRSLPASACGGSGPPPSCSMPAWPAASPVRGSRPRAHRDFPTPCHARPHARPADPGPPG